MEAEVAKRLLDAVRAARVDDEILWDEVQTKIPPLVRQLEDELKSAGYSF
jgi:hypothetical protein